MTLHQGYVGFGSRKLARAESCHTFGYCGFTGNGRDFLRMQMGSFGTWCNGRHPSL